MTDSESSPPKKSRLGLQQKNQEAASSWYRPEQHQHHHDPSTS